MKVLYKQNWEKGRKDRGSDGVVGKMEIFKQGLFLMWSIKDGGRGSLKIVFATFLLVCFESLKESTCETRENVFYFTSKALFVLEIIKF